MMTRDYFRNLISEIAGVFQSGEEMSATLSDRKEELVIYAEKGYGVTDIFVECWHSDGVLECAGYPLTTTREIADVIYDRYGIEGFETV